MYDVAVVGASVAGSAVATALARMGLRVVALEKRAAGSRKACGEGLFPAGVRALAGVLGGEVPDGAAISGVRFHAGGHIATGHFRGGEGLGIDRGALDVALRRAAACAGAEIREGVTVTGLAVADGRVRAVETNCGRVEARAFVAADGLGSRLRRLSGLDVPGIGRRYGVTAHIGADGPTAGFVDVVVDRDHELYVTPIGQGRWNVAVLTDREGMAALAGDLRGGFEALLARHARELAPRAALADAPLAAGPFPRGCRRTWRGNLVLAGDA
ncbi:MAG: NAD(P)/FAD-dependent oxidoreductase, partial [Hyphomicrobiales bacterium]